MYRKIIGNTYKSALSVQYLLLIFILFSCNTVKKVPNGTYLLDKNVVTINNKNISKSEVQKYVKQIPNRKILGVRFSLWLYNKSKDNKDNRFNRWLRKAGEAPVVLDPALLKRSSQQILMYLQGMGYYDATIEDTVIYNGKHAMAYYTIDAGLPYRIRNITYKFEDSALVCYVLPDTINSVLHKGDLFDINQLQNERARIESMLKNKGYYNFNKEYVFFEADSNLNRHEVDLKLGITKYIYRDSANILHTVNHRRYYIHKVYIIPQYNPTVVDSAMTFDTVKIDSVYFLCYGRQKYNLKVIEQNILIQPNTHFNLNEVDGTYKKISLLRNFKFINIIFKEDVNKNTGHQGDYSLDCYVQLTPYMTQSYQAEIEGTNNNGNFGAAVNLIYQHKNFFRRAQVFDFKIRGAYEMLKNKEKTRIYNTFEYGAEARLNIPQLLLPFNHEEFIKKYSPKTTILAAYNFKERPDYSQIISNVSFGYNWKGSPYSTYYINPFEINYAYPKFKDSLFQHTIENSFLKYSYQKMLINSISAAYIFSNQSAGKNSKAYYLSLRGESAGAFLRGYANLAKLPIENGVYSLFGTNFAQYGKVDFDFRRYLPVNSSDRIAYRIFAGIGVPYKNSISMPFVRRYFCGGSYSIRGWQPRAIGPGSSIDNSQFVFPMQTGDMKLEGSIEYRFNLISKLEGAMFIDAGNVWNLKENDPVGSIFRFSTFYNQIAVGSGIGLRYDFSFFILRFDIGMRTRDPAAPDGHHWPLFNGQFSSKNDMNYFIAIGYPF
jgi:outer membrane protein assembly factor BamA